MERRSYRPAAKLWTLLAILLVRTITISAQDNCILNFTQQPVTEIDCDVYQEPVIVLTCSVVSLSEQAFPDPSVIDIRWYFHNGTEYELINGVGHTRTGGNGNHVQVTSTLNVSGTSNQRFAFLGEGFYYCQVEMTDALKVVSNSSQRLQVLGRDRYVQSATSCAERTFIANVESCAAYEVVTTGLTTDMTPTTTLHTSKGGNTTTTPPNMSANSTTEPTSTSSEGQGGGSLEVWIYVLVAVAAVFAMIIIILAIMCVGLCLRRSQTMDANSLKQKENGGMHGHFISHSSSMINNDMYRGGMGIEETDLTTGTHCTSHSQISDNNYNTLGERDYEVIHNMPFHNNHASSNGDTKQEYHRLQRPSPPAVPTGRNGMFGYSPPSGEFRSMSTLTSQMNGLDSFCRKEEPGFTSKSGYSTLPARPPPPPYTSEVHVYGELENPATSLSRGHIPNGGIYHSPTDSSPPDSASFFERGDSSAQLLPPLPPRGTGLRKASSASNDSSLNESLYNPVFGAGGKTQQQHPQHPLQKIPETGAVFADPPNPTAFPVNDYDYIPTMTEYEKPVASMTGKKVGENPKTRVSTKSMNYETDPNLERRTSNDVGSCIAEVHGEAIMGFKLTPNDDPVDDSADITGEPDTHYPLGLKQGGASAVDELSSTGTTRKSSTGGQGSSVLSADYNMGASADSLPTVNTDSMDRFVEPKKSLQMNGVCYPDVNQSQSRERRSISRERRSFSQEAPSRASHTGRHEEDSSDRTQCSSEHSLPSHMTAGRRVTHASTSSPPPPSSSSASTLPQTRPHVYRDRDTSSLQHHINFTPMQVAAGTVV